MSFYRDIRRAEAPDEKYLERWSLIRTPLFGVYLHRFHSGDPAESGLHDHPWPFVSLPLSRRGYIEYDPHRTHWRRFPWPYYRSSDSFHRVSLWWGDTKPQWTLFIRGPHMKPWGFVKGTLTYRPDDDPHGPVAGGRELG